MTAEICPRCSSPLDFIEADPENEQPAIFICHACGSALLDDEIPGPISVQGAIHVQSIAEIVSAAPAWYTCTKCGHKHYKHRGWASRVYWDHFLD